MQMQLGSSRATAHNKAKDHQVNIYNRHFYLRGAEHQLRQAQYEAQLKQLAKKPKITTSSYLILCQQLENQLLTVFQKHYAKKCGQKFDIAHSQVDYLQFQSIVCQVIQISQNKISFQLQHFLTQIWLILCQYQIIDQLNADILYSTLRILMDPYNLNPKQCQQMLKNIQQFQKAEQNRQIFIRQFNNLQDETLTIDETVKLWIKIRYSNPIFTKIENKQYIDKNLTFKPQINKKSQFLASQSIKKYLSNHCSSLNRTLQPTKCLSKNQSNQLNRYLTNQIEDESVHKQLSHHDILYKRKLEKDSVYKNNFVQDSFCTTKLSRVANPSQIKQIVNNLYVLKQKKNDTDFVKLDEQAQLKQCTFSPKINKNYSSYRPSVSPSVKGYEKQVNRLHRGREQKQKKKQAFQNLGRVRNFSHYSKSPNKSIAPSFIDRDNPKLILQINIGGDRVQKLSLKGNQNSHLVSKKFVKMHGLQQQMVQVLQALIQQQLKNL